LRRFLAIIIIVISASVTGFTQIDTTKHKADSLPDKFYIIQNVDRDGEKLPEIEIKEVTITGKKRIFEGVSAVAL